CSFIDGKLLCVTIYKKGALAVRNALVHPMPEAPLKHRARASDQRCALHRQEAEHAFLNAAHRFMTNRWFRFERELGCRRMTCRYRWMASIVFINRAPERGTIFHL